MTQKQWLWVLVVVGVVAIALGFVVQSSENGSAAVGALVGTGGGRSPLPIILWGAGALALLGALVMTIARSPKG